MEEIAKIVPEEFQKKPDGSWVCVKNADIFTKSGRVIRISPGITFSKDRPLWDVDLATVLDEIGGS
jgi:hypothetical protein